ncbi:hypothetical protein KEM56_000037 [Ascosphaera pollenicola]|nr:hypothetical protein KEM56_000037 [Ascosphaera pollenicola]
MKRPNAEISTGGEALEPVDANRRVTRSRLSGGKAAAPEGSAAQEDLEPPATAPAKRGSTRGRDRGRGRGRGGRNAASIEAPAEAPAEAAAEAPVQAQPEDIAELSQEFASQAPFEPQFESQPQPMPLSQPMTQSISQSISESMSQPASQSMYQSMSQSQVQPQAALPSFTTAADLGSQRNPGRRRLLASKIHDVPKQLPPTVDGDQIFSQQPGLLPVARAEPEQEEDEFMEQNEMSEYTQRTKFSSTPGTEENPRLSLSHPDYGLPDSLVQNLSKLGINSIYPWQAACLLGKGHLTHEKNLVYSAPTGGGKSLVADVLMLKRVLYSDKKAILVLPYVALVQEKMKWLRKVCEDLRKLNFDAEEEDPWVDHPKTKVLNNKVRVSGFFGAAKSRASWADTDIAVCTIEKANSLINNAIEDHTIDDLGIVVVDEMHMLDDEQRGYLIEIMVTKLLLLQQETQIVAMSATLSNTEVLARWLHANYYISKYKPIPIEEHIVFNNAIYSAADSKQFFAQTRPKSQKKESAASTEAQVRSQGIPANADSSHEVVYTTFDEEMKARVKPVRVIDKSTYRKLQPATLNAMVALAIETAEAGYGALVFCGSRQSCQNNAMMLADAMPNIPELDRELIEKRRDLIASLSSVPSGLDPVFAKTVMRGVGYHHAGLTSEEREVIAEGYDKGVLKIMVATCSLAAGINLPARRVILCGARMGRELVGPALLRQMRGRAGRKGKDEVGETYLCSIREDLGAIGELFQADMPAIESGLVPEKRGVKRALLEAVATHLVASRATIWEYMDCTLLFRSMEKKDLEPMVEQSIKELIDTNLLQENDDGFYEATTLGQAIVAAAFSPEDGLHIHDELKKGLRSFVMDGDFHVFYMFTPLQANTNIDWGVFRDQINIMDDSTVRAMMFIGAKPSVINAASLTGKGPTDENEIRIYKRVYTTLQLRELSNEVPISDVAAKYNVPRGSVQNLATTCHGFAWGMVRFCQRMGWDMLAVVLEHMRDRLEAGAKADLLEMAQVAYVKGHTARLLRDNGFKNLKALAEADAKDLVPVLLMAQPGSSRKSKGAEENTTGSQKPGRLEQKMLERAEIIVASANRVWEREMEYVEIEE